MMSIKNSIKKMIISLHQIINNPNLYIAAVIGALVGGLMGGLVGLFSGGFIGYTFKIGNQCIGPIYHLNPDIIVGSIMGTVIGTAIGGAITSVVSIYKIHKKTYPFTGLSADQMSLVLSSSLRISIEIAIGMGLGAIIGSLKLPGIGSVLGSFIGIGLMLFTATLHNPKVDR